LSFGSREIGTNGIYQPIAKDRQTEGEQHPAGRWPSNVLLSDPELFDQANPYVVGSGATTGGGEHTVGGPPRSDTWILAEGSRDRSEAVMNYGDSGGYSRFFVIPKADRAERERGLGDRPKFASGLHDDDNYRQPGERKANHTAPMPRANVHPTVKPIDLMRHLVRLVTPVDGVVLDPFLGSGTTCLAASEEGFRSIGIEQSEEYLEIAKGRLMATPMGLGLDVPAPTTSRKVGRDKGGGTHCSFFPGKCEGHPGHGRYSPTIHANPNSEEPAA
jgi:hypothetical protein